MIAWWRTQSIRVRLVSLYTLALIVVLVPYAAASYLFMRGYLLRTMDETLQGEAEEAVLVVSEAALGSADPDALFSALRRLEAVEDVRYELWSDPDTLRYRERMSDAVLQALPPIGTTHRFYSVRPDGGERFRVVEQSIEVHGKPFLFRVVSQEEPIRAALAHLMEIQAAGLIVALLLAGIGGHYLARTVLGPVRLITERAQRLTASRLKDGIPVVNPNDELGQLTQAFNELFRTLHGSFERLQRFSADVSHQLRTPLTSIQAVAEVGLSRDGDGKHASLESVLEDVQRTRKILDGLLMLARAENRELPLSPTAIDLSELCREAVTHLSIVSDENNQSLQLSASEPLVVRADRQYVSHALFNIVDNAIKHGSADSAIEIAVGRRGSQAVISVSDRGPGIAAADRERVFERFYQVDRARAREHGGSGLGLSIASWSVRANGGTIELDSEPGQGSTFRIVLPLDGELDQGRAQQVHGVRD